MGIAGAVERGVSFCRGTEGSNPSPSSGESIANLTFGGASRSMTVGGGSAISKREAIATQLVNCSAKGDFKAIQILLAMLRDIEGPAEPGAADHDLFTEADAQIIQRIRARLRGEKE
jgi:hypothetical protein